MTTEDDGPHGSTRYTIAARHKMGVPSLPRNTLLQGVYKWKEEADYVCWFLNRDSSSEWDYTVVGISLENPEHDAAWVHKYENLKDKKGEDERA